MSEIQSPCVDICQIDATSGLCIGCRRTLDEIATWGSLSRSERARIMGDLPARAERLRTVS